MEERTPRSILPEPYQTAARRELRKIPTWKLQEACGKLRAGVPTGIELVERNRAYALSAIEELLWERGKLPTKGSSSEVALITVPIVAAGIGALSLATLGVTALTRSPPEQRVYCQDGQYLVSVRYPGQWNDIREFVQPSNPDVIAAYSQYGPDPWNLYDAVCRNIDYRRDIGEFWAFPSEVLASGTADCEDTSNLLTSSFAAGASMPIQPLVTIKAMAMLGLIEGGRSMRPLTSEPDRSLTLSTTLPIAYLTTGR
ncbi:unnamed protein product [marine sediment metagenome]|uniref:Uncharacterized protein n=1 Tax=marine sediment metagenome TaxID=412755 RepID=X1Q9V9_9ZZZZ